MDFGLGRVAVSLVVCCAAACRQEPREQSVPQRQQTPVEAVPRSSAPTPDVPSFTITGPTVIIAARRTRDGGGVSRGSVDSLWQVLDSSTAELKSVIQKRGVSTFLVVSDSLLITTDSGAKTVIVPFGDSTSYVLVARHRRPLALIDGRLSRAELLAEADWYLFTNEDPQEHAASKIRRLGPSAFPGLPAAFARELDSLGCTVPQSFFDTLPHNVIKGSFARRGQTDWAAICSRRGATGILIFWGGPSECPRDLSPGQEKWEVEDFAGGRPFYVRFIVRKDSAGIANIPVYGLEEETVSARKEALSGRGHDGIEDIWEEKGSTVWYCTGGRWVSLGGGD